MMKDSRNCNTREGELGDDARGAQHPRAPCRHIVFFPQTEHRLSTGVESLRALLNLLLHKQ